MTIRSDQILAIDLVRFSCALLVLAVHYAALFPVDADLPRDWTWWSWPGWVGVEIFFVVSGYVIACSAATSQGLDFLRRRVLRLAPAAWICATTTAVVLLASGSDTVAAVVPAWLASMTFWPIATQIDGSYWTLGIELAFYLLVAVRLDDRDNAREIERIGLALAGASALFWLWVGGGPPPVNRAIDLLLLCHGGFFATGIALWAIRAGGVTRTRLLMLGLGLAAGTAEIHATAAEMVRGIGIAPNPWAPLGLFAVAVAAIAGADRLQGPLARLGAHRLAVAGLMTYPLYLIHQRIGKVVIVHLTSAGVPGHAAMIAAAGVSLALAAIVVRGIEPGVRRWLAGRIGALSSRRGSPRDSLPSAFPPAG